MPVTKVRSLVKALPSQSSRPSPANGTTGAPASSARSVSTRGSVRTSTPFSFAYRSQAPSLPGLMRHRMGQASQRTMPRLAGAVGSAVFLPGAELRGE